MQIQFKGTHYELKSDMTDLATRKIQALRKYLGKSERPVLAYVDLGRQAGAQNSGSVWYADCNLDVEGKRYYAKAEANTLRTAVDKMVGELGRELRAVSRREKTEARKGGARLKEFFRFGR